MSAILLYQKRIGWGWLETITIALVIICVVVWCSGGSYWAMRCGILSEVFVGIYLIIKTFINPVVEYNLIGYIGFLIISMISMLTSKEWSVSEAGYATCEVILSVITIIPLLRQWRKERAKK
jgi:hypothetical protein